MTEPYISAREVAQHIGASVDKVYELAQTGEIPVAFRIGPRLRFDPAVVAGWVAPAPKRRGPRRRRSRFVEGVWVLSAEKVAALPTTGWVYFIQATVGGPIKIGLSQDVDLRLASLQLSSPFPLRLLATVPGGRRREYELHRQFAKHRLHGEWFSDAAPGLLALIQKAAA
jgi:excisionase family DNA binding protein